MKEPFYILVIDDEESIRFTLEAFLSEAGYRVRTAADYFSAVEALQEQEFNLVFADILLGGHSGIDLLRTIRKGPSDCPVIMITGAPDVETAAEAVRLGAFDYIPKPVRQETLLRVAKTALRQQELYEQKERYRRNLEAIFRSVKDAIVMVDDELRLVEFNEAAGRLCGLRQGDLGRLLPDLSDWEAAECIEAVRETLHTREPVELTRADCRFTDGKERVVGITSAPLRSDHDQLCGAVLVLRDETRLADLERDLSRRQGLHRLVGASEATQEVYRLIESVADFDTTVLLTGESGTGKELAAEAIHFQGGRRRGPLVKVNCAALPENLLESELFGHVKGAFTGAVRDQMGRFRAADGGTIFLDEIGDISPAMQMRLLRVLQERQVDPVGGTSPVPVDVRVIAATNQDLPRKIERGEFRPDLYYRLKVVNISLPPLRERREDIPLLVESLLEKLGAKLKKNLSGISDEVLNLFMEYCWPGNIRELEHALEHAAVLCRDSLIEVPNLPPELREFRVKTAAPSSPEEERARLLEAIARSGGNKAQAARRLKISRRTLYRKLKSYGLDGSN